MNSRLRDTAASGGAIAVRAYIDANYGTEDDAQTTLTDLLTDLMHWADRESLSFIVAEAAAHEHYHAEFTEGV